MSGNQTFTIIKPIAVKNNRTGSILKLINEAGFRIKSMKITHLTQEQAKEFYSVHTGKSFFEDLTSFMSSGPIVTAILEKENAVDDFRKLIGSTDPLKAKEGTIRKLFAESMSHNAIHGSDSDENALTESDFFFSKLERY
ncbi:MAG TPA: nucleoside-diphosphate kinase [Prolixibacteraceae bacterium]|nr:nucleoside-diphosphate kinase [Prolixibacteraceae bacterium]